MYRDYAPKGVKFYYIYKALAHPETNGYVRPVSLQERLMHIEEAKRTLGSEITWLADSMSNDVKHALGNAPNSEFVIDSEGKVIRRRSWSWPSELRQDLEELVGRVENPTQVADLNLKPLPPRTVAPSGVVPRLEIPTGLQAVKIEPKQSSQPFYVKLRAEATRSLLQDGRGKLYLGFHMDPIYHVHWNNLADPLSYEIAKPGDVTVSPTNGQASKVEETADIDPREFLLDVETASDSSDPLQLTVRYFACNDEKGWCKAIRQEYSIYLQPDRDAGQTVRRPSSRWGFVAGSPSRGLNAWHPVRAQIGRMKVDSLFARSDKDEDGKLTKQEVPEFLWEFISSGDSDGDGLITGQEFESLKEQAVENSSKLACSVVAIFCFCSAVILSRSATSGSCRAPARRRRSQRSSLRSGESARRKGSGGRNSRMPFSNPRVIVQGCVLLAVSAS